MAIAPVVTRGYGSFGSNNLVVTRGYLSGSYVPPPPTVPSTGSGGSAYYFVYTYEDERLDELRKKARHPTFVKEAAVESVTSDYYATKKKANDIAIAKLKILAADLQFKIAKSDLELLKLEVEHIRMARELDDEETMLLL